MRTSSLLRPVDALSVFFASAVIFAFGIAGSYLIWGAPELEPRSGVASSPRETTEPEQVGSTREDPLSIGADATVGDWTVVLGSPENGTKRAAEQSEYNHPPQEGFDFYFIPVTATYQGSQVGHAGADYLVKFVGDDSRTYSGACLLWDSFDDAEYEVYKGGVYEYEECIEVPKGAMGQWVVSNPDSKNKVFFRAD